MSNLAALAGGNQPIIHIYPPFQKDGQWYGGISVNIRGEPVKIIASASHALLQAAYEIASNYVSKYVSFGAKTGSVPAGSLRAKLQDLAPYLPHTGLDFLQRSCVGVIQQAANGCESCVDSLQTIEERAGQGDPEAIKIKNTMNAILTQAINRKGLIGQVALMSPTQFQAFLGGLSRM